LLTGALIFGFSKTQPVIFYCAWPHEAASADPAEKYRKKGFASVTALKGGMNAWQPAGYAVQAAE
jgi:rhodanese-related sulfurtransferase